MAAKHVRSCLGGLVAVFAAATIGWGCREEESVAEVIRPVRAIRIGDTPTLLSRTFTGTAEAIDAVDLSFRVGGPLVAFPANQLGQEVRKGELLAQIDTRDFEVKLRDAQAALLKAQAELDAMRKARPEEIEQLKAAVERAEASAEYARAENRRFQELVENNAASASEAELAAAQARVADAAVIDAKEALRIGEQGARPEEIRAKQSQIVSLQAAVERAEDELSDTKLLAPFDGVISGTYVKNFEVVQPQQRVVRMVNRAELEIRIDVPENLIALVPQVTEAFVKIQTYPHDPIPARIAEIGTEASPTTRTYPVKLRFTPPPESGIRPGMTGTVSGRGNSSANNAAPGYVVPAAAVFDQGEEQQVWIVDPADRIVQPRAVAVLETTPYGLRISGVEPGEWVVTAGVHYLKAGQAVRLPELEEQSPA
ncbi:efflux RND transporter periplasmic adaptor subunit [Candidatus Laterigemmans baculatus]|uniref:efflux RND transporter periplasmic adaptor subunit n=1 Tax=Candidatus Laterigemmans baculatus TaxID=2770505 RepID=UPI0013DAA61D|nr:efflux RND transporter periplasmic adaptor subunit [Candidatus Laterigemmans baculatus]